MSLNYSNIQIDVSRAVEIAHELYGISGEITTLPGELDFNFRIDTGESSYVLKISRPDVDQEYLDFHREILVHLSNNSESISSPVIMPDIHGNFISTISDQAGNTRHVRLLSWIDGRIWSSVNPQSNELLFSLGEQAGLLTGALQGFDHKMAHRDFVWDVARAAWTVKYDHLFGEKQQRIIKYFQQRFNKIQDQYKGFRKSVVHNDANDNNVIVSNDLVQPEVVSIIDFGDAIYTQVINDLAITIAYAAMNKPDVLAASLPVIRGYHQQFSLLEDELGLLYSLVGMRLVISVTKSAINKQKEPDNEYLLISEKPAWDVLEKWIQINENLAHYSFRDACGFTSHPDEDIFTGDIKQQRISIRDLFRSLEAEKVHSVDMSVSSKWLGHASDYNNNDLLNYKIQLLRQHDKGAIVAGGYLETRPLYCTDTYKKEGNNGPEYRSVHLGMDFWVEARTPVYALFDGKVFSIFNNAGDKDYGPTLILEHKTEEGINFYSLYGHLSKSTLDMYHDVQKVQKGDLIAYVGNSDENGNWAPHLHFQLMLDMLGNTHDFPGVAYPDEVNIWKSICPDPNLFFKETGLDIKDSENDSEIRNYRNKHLGKSLSLSYNTPLHIVKGDGVFLLDKHGRKYLDTVNNVAHVGHEHPRVVKAGQEQMAILNTNTRYLHKNINDFAKVLLNTFPEELSVVHLVNSGSEANELALRMANTFTGEKDMIAIEVGYHGNTSGCINISSYKFDGKGGKGAPEYTHIVPLPDSYRGLYRGFNTGEKYASHIQEQIDIVQQKGRNIAGFICESIMSCGGQIELPEGFLKIAYDAIRKAGGLCIADEVQVGCGRVGSKFWGFELHGVIPDIVTIGKPIGNGHPLAAVVCTREVADAFDNGMEYFNTFGGNPVSCAIGKEVLKIIREEHLQENALKAGNYLKEGLQELQQEFDIIGDVRGQGLFLGFELSDENKNPLTEKAAYLANRMKEFGILMSTDGKDVNVLKIKPPMVFSTENADELLLRLKMILHEDFMKH